MVSIGILLSIELDLLLLVDILLKLKARSNVSCRCVMLQPKHASACSLQHPHSSCGSTDLCGPTFPCTIPCCHYHFRVLLLLPTMCRALMAAPVIHHAPHAFAPCITPCRSAHRPRSHVNRALIYTTTHTKLSSSTHTLCPPWHRFVAQGGVIFIDGLRPASVSASRRAGLAPAAQDSAAPLAAVPTTPFSATASPAVPVTDRCCNRRRAC